MAQTYRRSDGISERRVDDVAFLVNPENEALYHLNPLGTALWRLLETPISGADAVDIIDQAFPDVGKDGISKDISALLMDLADHGLIHPADD